MDILDKFTQHLKNCLAKSFSLAVELDSAEIAPEHMMLALLMQKGSIGGELMRKANLSPQGVRRMLKLADELAARAGHEHEGTPDGGPTLSAEAKRAIEKAVLTANVNDHRYVGTEHLLAGLLQIDSPAVEAILTDQNVDGHRLDGELDTVLKSTSRFPEITETFEVGQAPALEMEMGEEQLGGPGGREGKQSALEFFAVELTSPKLQEGIDPVIGRDPEIERLIQVLCRRTKNNPVLLGEPGVGKTAIVEGLAKRIVEGEVPEVLQNKKIWSLDLGLMVAGTIYRGEFEGRIKQIIDEVKADPDLVVFIDELHNIMGAGSTNGSMDAANILKPALARGDMRCIGATTTAEYKKSIESDGALERRFQSIEVGQPSPEATIQILQGLRPHYEKWHHVSISDEAIEAAVQLSDRYLTDRQLPDKAIDLIDEAAACLRVAESGDGSGKQVANLEKELAKVMSKKQMLVEGENFIEALKLKAREKDIQDKLAAAQKPAKKPAKKLGTVGRKDVAQVISRSTGIPLLDLMKEEKQRLLELESRLGSRIIGQDETVNAVSELVRRAKSGIASADRPLASFLFVGPSGVGKTELAKVLAETVFNDPEALVKLDMSEFAEGFNVSKLIGAPAGYVGYRDQTKLTDVIKRKPHAVVLFDEIEKAHDEVHNLLLQVLEDGTLTDATGRKINFKNSIVIMTSNIGASDLAAGEIGFGGAAEGEVTESMVKDASTTIMSALEKHFRPEFLNRVDKVSVFKPLSKKDLTKIAGLQLEQLGRRVTRDYGVKLGFSAKAAELIADKSWNPLYGARGVRRQISELVENVLAQHLLADKFKDGDRVAVGVKGDTISVSRQKAHARTNATAKA
jgi:ATP-dependent Clp protease ATP-binding subunit ClpC